MWLTSGLGGKSREDSITLGAVFEPRGVRIFQREIFPAQAGFAFDDWAHLEAHFHAVEDADASGPDFQFVLCDEVTAFRDRPTA